MGKRWIITIIVAVFALGACNEKDVYEGAKDEMTEYNEFNFSTVRSSTRLEVNYLNCGIRASVYFEVYDEIPVDEREYSYMKRDDIKPLFAAFTADNGIFEGDVELPSYLKKVYIYSPAFFAKTLIEAEVENGAIKATDDISVSGVVPKSVSPTDRSYDSYMAMDIAGDFPAEYRDIRWKTWLGEYNKQRNGEIGYKYTGKLAATLNDGLYAAHTQVINTNKACPDEFRSYSDMYINENAEIAITFLGQNTCWNCSMGYYYYKEGEKPASLNDANVIMLFPNTQDGEWSNDKNKAKPTAGIDRLTAVQLKYYPDIASGSQANETTVFPAGYRIGFVIANNAWSNRISGFNLHKKYRAATSEGLSIGLSGAVYNEPRTAVYKYGDFVMISFEDHNNDQNFSDIVVSMKSNPVEAVTDIPVVDPENNRTTVETLKGVYAFEDLWPSKGDYDMNDVIVRYTYGKTFDKNNNIYAETFIFKTFQNMAGNQNGLAFRLRSSGSVASVTCSIRKPGEDEFSEVSFSYEAEDNVYLLTDNVKEYMGAEYKVTLTYNTPINVSSVAEPFIFKNKEGGKRWEVHIPKEAPTSKMDMSYFGKEDDASKPVQGIYYVRGGNYPFAFFLSGANESDLSRLLEPENESVPIDWLYSGYNGWVKSNGTDNKDWYKQ